MKTWQALQTKLGLLRGLLGNKYYTHDYAILIIADNPFLSVYHVEYDYGSAACWACANINNIPDAVFLVPVFKKDDIWYIENAFSFARITSKEI